MRLPAILVLAFATTLSLAQTPSTSLVPKSPSTKAPAVTYLFPEQVTIAAGKPTGVDLHFRIAPGLHINSHSPREAELIPTTLKFDDSAVTLKGATFPPGTDIAFAIDPSDKLSVYTDEFVIQARIVAPAGNHLVQAKLHFQACNNAMCMPPKTIPVAIDVIGK